MKSKTTRIRALPVRVKPVTAAVAAALGTLGGGMAAAGVQAATTDELIVTATRRDTGLQDVPYSMTAIGQEDIERLQIRDLSDIARWTPGLYQVDQGSREANLLIMRGINASNIGASELLRNTQGDRVGTYFGETPVYLDLMPVDIARVETQRGPQGTLYGSRSLGGTLRYIPNAPDSTEFSIDGRAGIYDMAESSDTGYNVDAVINLPLIEDTLAFRAVLGYQNRPGFIDQPFLVNQPGVSCPEPFKSDPDCAANDLSSKNDTNDRQVKFARFALRWDITDDFYADLTVLHQDDESGGRQISSRDSLAEIIDPSTTQPLDVGNYVSGMRFLEENERENNLFNLTLNYSANGFDVVSTTSYNTYEQRGTRDQTDLLLFYSYGDFPAFSAFTDDVTDDDFIHQEVRLVSNNPDSRLDWIAGAFYQKGDLQQGSNEFAPNYDAFVFGPPSLDDQVTFIDVTRDTREYAAFGEIGYRITEAWRIAGSARYFDVDDEIVNCIQFNLWQATPACEIGGESDSDIIFRLSSEYDYTDDLKAYALFSQGVSLGGVNPGAFVPENLRFLKPEKVNNYEVGLKSEWLDGKLQVNGAVYYMDWTDIHTDILTDDFIPVTVNAGEAESLGMEIDAAAQLNDHWQVMLGFSHTESELTNNSAFGFDGDRLPGAPETQLNLGVNYFTSISSELSLEASWWLSSQSDVYTRLGAGSSCCRDNGESLGGFTVHSASIGIFGERWSASLYSKNIFNKYAETGVRDDTSVIGLDSNFLNPPDYPPGSGGDFALRRYYKNVLTPRTIGLELRYRFKGN